MRETAEPLESGHQHSGGENLEVMKDAVRYNQHLRDLIADNSNDAETVLDFGAGIGTFSDSTDVSPQNIWCVEPDANSRTVLTARQFNAFESIEEIPDNCVDYVFSLNVLEHIEDDDEALRQLFRVTRPGGTLFLYVPAFMTLFTSMDKHVGHFRRYRRKPLIKQVENANYAVKSSAYTDSLGFFATLAFKVFDGAEPAPLNPKMVKVYDRFFYPLSRILSIPLARTFGKNVFVVGKKSV